MKAMTEARFVVCIDNTCYPASLEVRKLYRLMPDDEAANHELVRVIDESGEAYLYPASCFMLIDLPRQLRDALLQAA